MTTYRFARAQEMLDSAEVLIREDLWNSAINRLYYAAFHAVSAYLASQNTKAATHKGLKAIFHKELVKTGKISIEEGKKFSQLFRLRQDVDYEDFKDAEEEDVALYFGMVENLIEKIRLIIDEE